MGWVIDYDNYIIPRRFPHNLDLLSMMARWSVASTSGSGRPQKSSRPNTKTRRLKPKSPVGLLFEWEFRAHFHISDNIYIYLIDGEALSSADQPNNTMYFTKK